MLRTKLHHLSRRIMLGKDAVSIGLEFNDAIVVDKRAVYKLFEVPRAGGDPEMFHGR